MSRSGIYARSLAASWVGFFANVAVGLFLMPYLITGLGKPVYGFWSLAANLTGYLGLVDIGVCGSTGRFINFYLGRGDRENVSRVINTSILYYSCVSLLILGAALVLGVFFEDIFRKSTEEFSPDAVANAKWVLLLLGANVWIGFITATFSQLLQSATRFDLKTVADLCTIGTRVGGAVWVVSTGGSVVQLALVQVGAGVVSLVLMAVFARWKGPPVSYGPKWASREIFKQLFNFGTWAFIGNIAIMLVLYTDSTVITLLIGFAAVTVYGVGFSLMDYGRRLVGHVAIVMSPDIQQAAGRQDYKAMRLSLVKAVRVTMALAVPVFVGFLVQGTEFIRLWQLSPKFVEADVQTAGYVLMVLAVAQFSAMACRPCGAVLSGLGHVKFLGLAAMGEALCNLGLSVFFVMVMGWGLVGVALGTMIPMIANTILLPAFTCRKIDMSFWMYTWRTAGRWVVAAIVFGGLCLVGQWLVPAVEAGSLVGRRMIDPVYIEAWLRFAGKVAVLGVLWAPIGWLVVLGQDERQALLGIIRRRRAGSAGEAASGGSQAVE